jgi:hypothetical protein
MNPLTSKTTVKAFLIAALALVPAAPAAAGPILDVNEPSNGNLVTAYSWGAAATYAKQKDLLSQYGWGAAATYAKLQLGQKAAPLGSKGTAFKRYAKAASATARAQQELAARTSAAR